MPKTTASEVDLSEFAAIAPVRAGCWYARLEPEQAKKVDAALAAGYSQPTVRQVLRGWGMTVGRSTMQSHVRGECSCGK